MERAVHIYLTKMCWLSHSTHLTSKQIPAHSPPSTDRNTPPAEMGEDLHRRGKLMFTKEFTGLSRRKKTPYNML